MTTTIDHSALLDSLSLHPTDRTVRLILADLLADSGEDAQADLLRSDAPVRVLHGAVHQSQVWEQMEPVTASSWVQVYNPATGEKAYRCVRWQDGRPILGAVVETNVRMTRGIRVICREELVA